jgi:hypothetical protein
MADSGVIKVKGATSGIAKELEQQLLNGAAATHNRADEWTYTTIDLSTDAANAVSGGLPAVIGNIWVNAVLSAHACPILDGATTIYSLPASAPVTTTEATAFTFLKGTICATSLIVNSNDAATGTIVVQWRLYTAP